MWIKDKNGEILRDAHGKKFWMDNFLMENFNFVRTKVQNKVAHRRSDLFVIVDGPVGCLTGDTIIRYNRGQIGRQSTLKWMFNQLHGNPDKMSISNKWNLKIPTFVRSYDGHRIKLHKMLDVVYSGKKMVYEIKLEDGKKIKATANHKIMTARGFIELSKLQREDCIMTDDPHAHSINKISYRHRDTNIGKLKYHPYKTKQNRVEIHRLCYEAY